MLDTTIGIPKADLERLVGTIENLEKTLGKMTIFQRNEIRNIMRRYWQRQIRRIDNLSPTLNSKEHQERKKRELGKKEYVRGTMLTKKRVVSHLEFGQMTGFMLEELGHQGAGDLTVTGDSDATFSDGSFSLTSELHLDAFVDRYPAIVM